METFGRRVYGLPVEKFDSQTISLSRIAVTKKLRSEQGFIQRSVDPEFIAMKKKIVALLQKIRKDLKKVERHYTKKY
jgi:hypothetical protein